MARSVPLPRSAVAGLPTYKPGKAAEVAMAEHSLESAIKLASNENPFAPLPSVLDAITNRAASSLNRYADHRATEVREALAARYGLEPERVTVGCGSVGLLQQLFLAYADQGQEVAYGWRSFESYPIFTGLVGATAVTVPNRLHTVDCRGLLAAASERTRLVMVTSPNNPTGTAVSHDDLEALLDGVPDQTLVVLDEAYHEYVTGQHAPRALELLARYPNFAVLRTFSKAYGLASLRIGYMLAHPDVVSAVDRALIPFAVNGLAQAAALASLEADEELGDRVNHTIAERERVARELRGMGLSVADPQANFVWMPAGDASATLTLKLEQVGVVTRPFPGEGVRVTIGTPAGNDRFLAALAGCIEPLELPAHWALPTGVSAKRVQALVDRLDAVQERLVEHAVRRHEGVTPGDDGEPWDASQIWGHLGESPGFFLAELQRMLAAEPGAVPTIGRPQDDPTRTGAAASGRTEPVGDALVRAQRAVDGVRALVAGASDEELAAGGRRLDDSVLTVFGVAERFVAAHLEEHLTTLDTLAVNDEE
jgi:histidinol-phosphate aminotransferase